MQKSVVESITTGQQSRIRWLLQSMGLIRTILACTLSDERRTATLARELSLDRRIWALLDGYRGTDCGIHAIAPAYQFCQ